MASRLTPTEQHAATMAETDPGFVAWVIESVEDAATEGEAVTVAEMAARLRADWPLLSVECRDGYRRMAAGQRWDGERWR